MYKNINAYIHLTIQAKCIKIKLSEYSENYNLKGVLHMISDLLWVYGAKQQHDIIKSTGRAGAISLILALFIIWQWDSIFFPILDFFGFTTFAENVGAVSDESASNFLNVYYLIIMLAYIFAFIIAIPTFIFLIFCTVIKSKILSFPFIIMTIILCSPLYLIYTIVTKNKKAKAFKNSLYSKLLKNEEVNEFLKSCGVEQKQQMEGYTFIAQEFLKGADQTFLNANEATSLLNKVVVDYKTNNSDWLLGYSSVEDRWYLLTYNPIPAYASKCAIEKTEGTDQFNYRKIKYENNEALYTIACALDFSSNESIAFIKRMKDTSFTVKNVEELDEIMQLTNSPVLNNFMNELLNSQSYVHIMGEAISRAFLIPYFHRNESIKYYEVINNKRSSLSAYERHIYYEELFKLDGGTRMSDFTEELSKRSRLVAEHQKEDFNNFIHSQKHLKAIH